MAKPKVENYVGGAGNIRMCDKPMARWGRRVVALGGDPKWERRRIVDPEYKSVIYFSEGWYVPVFMVAERDDHFIGWRYVPLVELKQLDGKPWPVPPRPEHAPVTAVRDPYFKSEVRVSTTPTLPPQPAPNAPPGADMMRIFRRLRADLFDVLYEHAPKRVLGAPVSETWRSLNPPEVRGFAQNRYEGYEGMQLLVAAESIGAVAIYKQSGKLVLVADCNEGVVAVHR